MFKKNIIRIVLSISLLLLLILSCDERAPVASPPADYSYLLTLSVDNSSCVEPASYECSDGTLCNSIDDLCEIYTCTDGTFCDPEADPCDDDSECAINVDDTECVASDTLSEITADSMCYASNSAMGEIVITAILTDVENSGAAVPNKKIEFIAVRVADPSNDDIDLGYLTYDTDTNPLDDIETYVAIDNEENTPITNTTGQAEVVWFDNLAIGNFKIIAEYIDEENNENNVLAETTITLISTENRINEVNGFLESSGILYITDENPLPTANLKAMVLSDASVPLPNITVNFSKESGSGSIQPASSITNSEGIASTEYTTAPGTDNDTIIFNVSVNGPASCSQCSDEIELIVSSDVFPQEYFVTNFSLDSDLYQDSDNDGKRELILLDGVDTTYTIAFEAIAKDISVIGVENVPVFFRNLSSYGTLTIPEEYGEEADFPLNTNSSGQSTSNLLIDQTDIPSGSGEIPIEAKVMDPESSSDILKIFDFDDDLLTDTPCEAGSAVGTCDRYAIDTVYVEVFTQQYNIVSNITDLIIETETSETIENNNTIDYETSITARTIDSNGGLVTEPVVVKFKKFSGYCAEELPNGSGCDIDALENSCEVGTCHPIGGFLSGGSTITTDSTGTAQTLFEVNSSAFPSQGAHKIAFEVYLEQVPNVKESFDESYFIEGSQDPESDVEEFEFYPNSDTISHALFEETNISVIAKNSAGVGISDVLVRFNLDEITRGSYGELSSGYEYTCCGESDEGSGEGEDSYSCPDGSSCSAEDDSACPGECSSGSSGGGSSGGQNGVATVTYTNVEEGMDNLYAYILNPENQSDTLKIDTLVINSIPNCPDCAEQLILVAEDYILPDSFSNSNTNIYAFYTDSLGNPAAINDVISFEAIQYPGDGSGWIDVGSISPENAFWASGLTEPISDYIPAEFENIGSSIIYAQSVFNMENSSGLARIVATFQGATDTLGIQINSTEASFVEILAPYPSEIMVQGGGGQESTIITAEIRDGNGNLVTDSYFVKFEITEPQLDGLHLNGIYGTTTITETSSNGAGSVTLNSGRRPGTVHLRVTVTKPGDSTFEPLIAEATPVTVTTGPPTNGILGYAFGEAVNFGASFTEMPISVMLWDAWANPVSDCTAVYFTLDPPNTAAIIPEAKTGGANGDGDSWPGMAWTTTQYSNAQLFEIPEIIATTTGNICINQNAPFDTIDGCLCTAGTWDDINNECDGGFMTGNKWLEFAADGSGGYGLCAITDLYNPEICDIQDYFCNDPTVCVNCDCETSAISGFGTDPDEDNIYWGIALPIIISSYDNQVDYENVCVDCELNLLPVAQGGLGNTQHDFTCNTNTPYEIELVVQVQDSFGVNVEGALVDLIIYDSQGGPIVLAAGCRDENGNILNDPTTGPPTTPYDTEQECLDAGGLWGYIPNLPTWINEYAPPTAGFAALQLKTDHNGLKYFKITFSTAECTQTSPDPVQFTCSSPIIEANLFSPNGGVSNQINITINNTCLPGQEP